MIRKKRNPVSGAADRARNCQGLAAFDGFEHNPISQEFQALVPRRPLHWQTVATDPGLADRWQGMFYCWSCSTVFEEALAEAENALDCLFRGICYVPADCTTQAKRLQYYGWCCDIVQLSRSRMVH